MTAETPESEESTESVLAQTERMLVQAGRVLSQLQSAVRFNSAIRADGTCPIFFRDNVQYIALPWADFDTTQIKILSRRAPLDDLFLLQLIDFVPSLAGKSMIDVGSYTGTTAMILRALLNPSETHLFEPQKTMKEALETTISANGAKDDVTLHTDVIDEHDQEIIMGSYRPDRLADVPYLRRDGGDMRSKSIDSFDFKDVGYISLDFNNGKINAMRGAADTIKKYHPILSMDLTARDLAEVEAFLEPFEYKTVRAGRHSVIFLPT